MSIPPDFAVITKIADALPPPPSAAAEKEVE